MIKRLLFLGTFLMLVAMVNGQQIPKWKMKDVVRSFSAKNDTTYVVNFWATFCKPCIEEIPDFIRIVEKYKSKKVKLLLVSLDLPSFYPAKLAAFAKRNNYKTNIAWLNETNADIFCPMIDAKWSGAIPATIIVNNKTGYKKFTEDQISPEDFEKYLNEAISGSATKKYMAPMNDAEITDHKLTSLITSTCAGMDERTTFKSKDSSVYSIGEGKVSTIVRLENFKVVIIQSEQMFFTYSNLGSTILKTGDIVKHNQFIGFATNELYGNEPTLELYVNDEKGNTVPLSRNDFITQKDKRFAGLYNDTNEPQ